MSKMRPTTETELGQEVRRTIHRHVGRLSGNTRSRDRQMVSLVAERHPGALDTLGKTPIAAAMRELGPGTCSWDSCRMLAAANDEPMPQPTPALLALLGTPCRKCQGDFQAAEIHQRERAMLAAGQRRPNAPPAPPPATSRPLPPFYGSRRLQPGSRR
jgi:hypothetical protein